VARPGKVWLVGAGPGDPGLLTLKGREVLRRADVIFYDRLVNPGILVWAKTGAEVIDVGKEPGGKRVEQPDICRGLIQAARMGKEVIRLKGGDPFVFGRGGEEAEALAKAGIPFEVVPGVTAGVAAPAMEGIPVTHRGLSTELVFKIGARAEGSVSGRTLVGYMSVEGLKDFLEKAVESGFSPETPAAVISRGTCRGQKTLVSTVADLAMDAKRAGIRAPAVVVAGGVVALRKWIGQQNRGRLAGQRVVLTVSADLGKGWRERFEEHGAEVWELPMTKITHYPNRSLWKKEVGKTAWIVLTSGAGVRALPGIVSDARKLAGKKIAVVGQSTAEILKSIGLRADFIGPGPGSEALARSWPGNKLDPVLHITGNEEGGGFAGLLQKKGYRVRRLVVYKNEGPRQLAKPVREALRREGADWVIFASGTAAERFRRLVPRWQVEPKVAVIGPATARKARVSGWRINCISHTPSGEAVLDSILTFSSKNI
jgi:uroporphyrinogen III methyltransferase/synthase